MKVLRTALPDVLVLEPRVFGDARGWFYESHNRRSFREATGIDVKHVHWLGFAIAGGVCGVAQKAGSAGKVLGGKARQRERGAARIVFDDADEFERGARLQSESELASAEDVAANAIDAFAVRAILDGLPDEVASAMTLHVLMDLKIWSSHSAEITVASAVGCSERKARELIATGKRMAAAMMEMEGPG